MIRPFGLKAARFIRRPPSQDAQINILEGSIRSAKTWAVNAKLVLLLASGYWPGGIGLISGKSKTSIKTNLLNDLFNILGAGRYRYNQHTGELRLCGRQFIVVGASDESAWQSIRGATVGIWIADEMTLYPESFFLMALSRMSLPGSRMYGTTNPGTPYHYLKAKYLDNPELKAKHDLTSEHFLLEDNPNLAPGYVDGLKRFYTGVFYQRYILGLWVQAEGAIYADALVKDVFYTDEWREKNLPEMRNGAYLARYIGVDYGTTNPCVFIDVFDDGDTLWFDREWYWDSSVTNRQLTDSQYADELVKFMNGADAQVIIDPSAASFAIELRNRGIFVLDADNEVLDGIRVTASLLANGKMKINRDGCPIGTKEMQTYAWNEKSALRGVEEPIKAHDHWPDDARYVCKTVCDEFRLSQWGLLAS